MTLTNYWWLLIWIFAGGMFFSLLFPRNQEVVLGKSEERWNFWSAVLLFAPFVLWAGLRDFTFGDTAAYKDMFLDAPNTLSGLGTYLEEVTKDKGFTVLIVFFKSLISDNYQLFFVFIAIFQGICLVLIFRKYSCNYWFSIFVFVASTEYLSWMHNSIRQFIAVTMIFAASELLFKKKYVPLILVILVASTIHGSALLMIPFAFILQGRAWNKKTLLCILVAAIILMSIDQFTNILDTVLSDTQYTNVVSDWQSWNDDGTSIVRVLVYSVPAILSLIGYRFIKKADDPVINIATNASALTAVLAIISMATSGIFMGRLFIYTNLYSMGILLPWEIKNIFTKDSSRFVYCVACIAYVIFFYFQLHFSWGIL